MNAKHAQAREAHAAKMRLKHQIKRIKKRTQGSVGPICYRCLSPLGSAWVMPGTRNNRYYRCRACGYTFNNKYGDGKEARMPWPTLVPGEKREREIEAVYQADCNPRFFRRKRNRNFKHLIS